MNLSISQWHARYLQQAQWTQSIRSYLLSKTLIDPSTCVLDIGCGTGVLERELAAWSTSIFGVDIDSNALNFATGYAPQSRYIQADANLLPFQEDAFDITLCHFLLLWVQNAQQTLAEMIRVTRPNGYILALAEPDYGGRIDFPTELSQIGDWQISAIKKQGANPCMGRELRAQFSHAGLVNLEVGVLGGQWMRNEVDSETKLEWEVINSDLADNPDILDDLSRLKMIDQESRMAGQRILFIPTFYAAGVVKK